jgi:hypothetical protein
MRDADARHVECRAEVKREAGPAGMVTSRRVHQQHFGEGSERADGAHEDRKLAPREQPGLIRCAHHSFDHGFGPRHEGGRRECPVVVPEADEAAAGERTFVPPPQRRPGAPEALLLGPERLAIRQLT